MSTESGGRFHDHVIWENRYALCLPLEHYVKSIGFCRRTEGSGKPDSVPVSRMRCLEFFNGSANGSDTFKNMSVFREYEHDFHQVKIFFEQYDEDRSVLFIEHGEKIAGEISIRYVGWNKMECSLGINRQNDSVKNGGWELPRKSLHCIMRSLFAGRPDSFFLGQNGTSIIIMTRTSILS